MTPYERTLHEAAGLASEFQYTALHHLGRPKPEAMQHVGQALFDALVALGFKARTEASDTPAFYQVSERAFYQAVADAVTEYFQDTSSEGVQFAGLPIAVDAWSRLTDG